MMDGYWRVLSLAGEAGRAAGRGAAWFCVSDDGLLLEGLECGR